VDAVNKLSALMALSMLAGLCMPWAAQADDIVTLTYQGMPLTGTYSSAVSGLPTADPFVTSLFTGSMMGSVVLRADPDALAGYDLLTYNFSYNFSLDGSGDASGVDIGFDSAPTPVMIYAGNCIGSGNCIGIYSSNGVITGADIDLRDNFRPVSPVEGVIGPNGDSASFVDAGCSFGVATSPRPTYTGPTCVSYLTAANSTAGMWSVSSTATPEIDPGTAGTALTLLAGFAAIMRGRRRIAVEST
jgi:hypothetical protein